ncbi:MAG: hypothetical protein R3E32_05105 [Chitinophagales bacterium]
MSDKKGSTSSALLLLSMVILVGLVFYRQLFEDNGLLVKGKTDNCDEYLQDADSLFAAKQYDKALNVYQNVLDCKPNDRYTKAQIRECTENLDDTFQRTFGGAERDEGRSVVSAHNGGYVIAANTESFGSGGSDIHLMKLDRLGQLDWRRNYGGLRDEKANDLIATKNGGYLVVGSTQTYGKGEEDMWLLKLNSSGRKDWERTYGGEKQDIGLKVIALQDGNFVLSGLTQSQGMGKGDVWLLKIDADGDVLWEKTMGGEDWDVGMDVVEAEAGSLIVVGYSQSFNEKRTADGWAAKIDASGDSIYWTQTFGGEQSDIFTNIVAAKDSTYILAGNTKSYGNGAEDVWMLKIDNKGRKIWQKTVGGKGRDIANNLMVTSMGEYTVVGQTSSAGAGAEDAWLLGMDESGRFLWKNEVGSKGMDSGTAIVETADKGYVMVGATPTDKGDMDIWVIHLDGRGRKAHGELQ